MHTDVLRKDWGFDGYVMTDWGAMNCRVEALKAGCNLEMPGGNCMTDKQIVKAVNEGELEEKILDQSCEEFLNIVFKYVENHRKDVLFDRDKDHEAARALEEECIVLLKNEEDILPLCKEKKVAFIGKYAAAPRYQGGGSSHINSAKVDSALEAVKAWADVVYAKGYDDDKDVINETMTDPMVGILHHEEGVDLVPANLELSAMEFNLVNAMSRETTLKNYLSQVKNRYDYVIIDCMPSLGMVTLNALSAADSVIIPVQAQYLPAKGMTQLVQTISKVKKYINPDIKIDGMLLTLVDSRTNLAKSTVEALRANFGNQIRMYRTQIPIAVKAAETSSKGKSIYAYEPNSTVSKAYAEFTKEVLADGRKKERLHSHEAR